MIYVFVFQFRIRVIMWHEARKQEKKIRGLMVDYKKRAERRREYYEKIVRIEECLQNMICILVGYNSHFPNLNASRFLVTKVKNYEL